MKRDETRSLTDSFRRLIRTSGPISLSQYMGESNARYYAGKDPLGTAGDFITAPEISQMFGELIGLWLADIWKRAGSAEPVHYVELGPGRGTLAKDALRSEAQFGLKPQVHFIEGSPALKAAQHEMMPDAIWHNDLTSVPVDAPILLVANEFFDALPVRQLVRTKGGWRERMVGLDGDTFAFVAGEQDMAPAVPQGFTDAAEGAIIETCPGAAAIMHEICERLNLQSGAALLIDYGYSEPCKGSTLQALSSHMMVDPLSAPGEADLTAHVDFATLAQIAERRETGALRMLGTVTQGNWLKAMGIEARAQKLAAAAPSHADELTRAVNRLTSDDQMGKVFKVMGLTAPDWPKGAGFPL